MKLLQPLVRILALSMLLFVGRAQALTINFDLGNVGSSFLGSTVNLAGPNAEDVRILFNNSKHIELSSQTAGFNQISWGLSLTGGNFFADMEFGFLDATGNVLLSSIVNHGVIASAFHGRSLSVHEPIDVYGMFFNAEAVGPISAISKIQFVVNGIVEESGSIPEPASLALFGLGLGKR